MKRSMPDSVPDSMTRRMPYRKPDSVPDSMTRRMPYRKPDSMTRRMPECTMPSMPRCQRRRSRLPWEKNCAIMRKFHGLDKVFCEICSYIHKSDVEMRDGPLLGKGIVDKCTKTGLEDAQRRKNVDKCTINQ
jgi:hypothetical protein